MKEIEVEGYRVVIERDSGSGTFTVSVPDLPGCVAQVEKEELAKTEIRKAIGLYMQGLASMPKPRKAEERDQPQKKPIRR